MASRTAHSLPISTETVFQDVANRRLFDAATRFAELLNRLGHSIPAYSESALLKLAETPATKKEQIASDFECWSNWIEPLDPTTSYDNEITLLKRALEKHGFEADDEFWKTIEKGQIIEFYNEDMVQLYRSFNFYAYTGYSLLDISLYEWYLLWDRPAQILESIGAELMESLQTHIPVRPFRTRKHLVREIFNATNSKHFRPRASLLQPVRLGSLTSKKFGAKKGFICTSTGETIAVGDEAKNIQFL